MTAAAVALEIKAVTAGYSRELTIIDGVDLSVRQGQVTVIVGPNGAGKSTLLRTIYGYLHPRQGEILHEGKSLVGLRPKDMLSQGIAYLLQGRSTFPSMTVRENLELGAWTLRGDRQRRAAAFAEVYRRFPWLERRYASPVGLLSGGEQRMLEIARLTMTNPKTLLLDEPSVGLMPKLVDAVYDELRRFKEEKFTILIVDQNIRKSIEIADYVYVLKLGRNSHHGPQAEFVRRLPEIIKEWL